MAKQEKKQEITTLMTESQNKEDHEQAVAVVSKKKIKRRSVCLIVTGTVLLLLIIVAIILAFTLFKTKEPRTHLVSATLEGVAPSITLPVIEIQLNVTLGLKLQVQNRNRASLKHQGGKSVLLYEGKEVGVADIYPGVIPSRGTTVISCRLTLEAEKLASNLSNLVGEIMGGEISMSTVTRIPGRVTLLGFIKRHIVAMSNCQFTISISEFKITKQTCKNKAKL